MWKVKGQFCFNIIASLDIYNVVIKCCEMNDLNSVPYFIGSND